jgi:S2P endopeptidase
MFIPTAFVEISPDQLLKISIWKRLKIIAAGIWHNYVLGTFCALLLLVNPLILSPLYARNQGVVVSYVDKVIVDHLNHLQNFVWTTINSLL